MRRSEFIKKVLKHKNNTVFTTKEQVENTLEIFEKFGMLPPPHSKAVLANGLEVRLNDWEPEYETK